MKQHMKIQFESFMIKKKNLWVSSLFISSPDHRGNYYWSCFHSVSIMCVNLLVKPWEDAKRRKVIPNCSLSAVRLLKCPNCPHGPVMSCLLMPELVPGSAASLASSPVLPHASWRFYSLKALLRVLLQHEWLWLCMFAHVFNLTHVWWSVLSIHNILHKAGLQISKIKLNCNI